MKTLEEIVQRIADVMKVSVQDIKSRQKSEKLIIARGLYYLVAHNAGYRTEELAKYIGRSRTSCVTTIKRYAGYIDVKDKLISEYYNTLQL